MKPTIALLVLFALVLTGGYWWSQRPLGTAPMAAQTATTASATSTPPADTSTATSSYTFAQVQTHNTSRSCWAAVNGNVYDLTTWISRHPGGAARILSICGKDGTPYFMGQHGNSPTAQAQLAAFQIGTLAQ